MTLHSENDAVAGFITASGPMSATLQERTTVADALSGLQDAITFTRDRAERLLQRIDPVLVPATPNPGPDSPQAMPADACAVTHELLMLADRIRRLGYDLDAAADRVAL